MYSTDPQTATIKVAIVEDDHGIRENLAKLINGSPGFRCGTAYGNAEAALEGIGLDVPDVVLMDINLPQMSGIECVRKLKVTSPALPVMMLTVYEDSDQLFNSLMAGASGYLLKRTPPEELLAAINEMHRGGSPMSRQIARKVTEYFHKSRANADPDLDKLTPRENEILVQLAKGFRYKEIADVLKISTETVRGHLRSIYDKLHVHSRTEAVVKYLQK